MKNFAMIMAAFVICSANVQADIQYGDLLVSEYYDEKVVRFDAGGNYVDDFIIDGLGSGSSYRVHDVVFSPDYRYILVSSPTIFHGVKRYDALTGTYLGSAVPDANAPNACGLEFGPDGHLFCTDGDSAGGIREYVLSGTMEMIGSPNFVITGIDRPWGLGLGPNGNLLIPSWGSQVVYEYEKTGNNWNYVRTFDTTGLADVRDVVYHQNGKIYVSNGNAGTIVEIDYQTGLELRTMSSLSKVGGLTIGSNGNLFALVGPGADCTEVAEIDIASWTKSTFASGIGSGYDLKFYLPNPNILSPNGGEELIAGQSESITWQIMPDINNVSIEYSYANGLAGSWNIIDANTPNDGEHDWTIPNLTSNQCLVRVSDVSNPSISDTSDDVFMIYRCLHSKGDLNKDCFVDFVDVAELFSDWLKSGDIDDGLVTYWSFYEGNGTTAHDVIGGNNGILNGDPNWVNGISGKALEFNGISSWVESSLNTGITENSDFTISFWMYMDNQIDTVNIISLGTADNMVYEGQNKIMSICTGHTATELMINIWSHTNNEWFDVGFDLRGSWNHIAATYNGTNLEFFVNGVSKKTKPVILDLMNDKIRVAGVPGGDDSAPSFFDGKMDEVRIYNRALTATEIEYLYQNP